MECTLKIVEAREILQLFSKLNYAENTYNTNIGLFKYKPTLCTCTTHFAFLHK